MASAAIQATGLKKSYLFPEGKRSVRQVLAALIGPGRGGTRTEIIKGIDLTVQHGEILGIIGRNGAGKSTLLKILTGVVRPTSGKIEVQGNVSAILELGMGLNPELNGYENIRFVGSTRGLRSNELLRRTPEIIEFAAIGEYIHYPVRTYSTGMRARLAFAIATAIDPEILIVDEVLAVGDALFQRKCYQRLHELMSRGTTVLLVTHDISAVRRLCTRALLIERGEILADGDPKEVTRTYEAMVNDLSRGSTTAMGRRVQSDPPPRNSHQPRLTSRNLTLDIGDLSVVDEAGDKALRLQHGVRYQLRGTFVAEDAARGVSFGIAVKNHRGEAIFGEIVPTPSQPPLDLLAGQPVILKWNFEALMMNGTYFVTIDVRSHNRATSLFCVEDVLSFQVDGTPPGKYVGLFTPRTTLSIASE